MNLPRFLQVAILAHRRRVILDDIEHYEGVARVGESKIAAIRADNERRAAQAEAIGRKLQLLERPDVLIRAGLEARRS